MLKALLGEEDEDAMMLKALLGEEDEDDMMLKALLGEEDEDVVMLKALLGEEDQDADTNSCFGRAAFAMPANYGAVPAGSEVEPRRRRRRAVAFSPDGSRLARAEGNLVVVCDTTTGFVECTLSEHSDT